MVALLTPDFLAIASMLVASTPCSATSSSAANRLFCGRLHSAFAPSSDLNFREQIAANKEQRHGSNYENRTVCRQAKMRHTDEGGSKAIHAICQRIEARDDAENSRQVVEWIQSAGQKEHGHHQEVHDHLKALN